MDTNNTGNGIYTECVQCPYCHEIIKAPNKPNVTFLCPNCGKELITYDKKEEANNRLTGSLQEPENIRKWNWGAFMLSWIWGIMNGIYWPLYVTLAFLFINLIAGSSTGFDLLWLLVYTGMSIALGINGNKWAWEAKDWDSADDFQETQRKWSLVGLCILGISIFIIFIAIVFFQATLFTLLS